MAVVTAATMYLVETVWHLQLGANKVAIPPHTFLPAVSQGVEHFRFLTLFSNCYCKIEKLWIDKFQRLVVEN